ncbi:hypothetical protein [Mesorhizobium sp. LNHC209A00]|uniref:hypothetical protein n=1 Tax=Mesorhizobium TaxID=68287 RepID=UPI0003CE1F9C|nr:hypothetical protein [Mesorhizobium sp. LNHC209A00]ESY77052.1 hypothetical protein X739_33420 [Mesorhizobium sp. LNHC220B00]ESY90218.1 hypothetical protein X738_30805 [Mesorhizobium sp. LNHC209A00]
MGDDVDGLQPRSPFQRLGDLACRRPVAVQHDRFDPRPQIAQDRLEIGRGWVDEKNFGDAGHGEVSLGANSTHGKSRLGRLDG